MNLSLKYDGDVPVFTLKKLLELISRIETLDDWNEVYALTEYSCQHGKITAADESNLLTIIGMICVYPCSIRKSQVYWDGYHDGWDAAESHIRAMYGLDDGEEMTEEAKTEKELTEEEILGKVKAEARKEAIGEVIALLEDDIWRMEMGTRFCPAKRKKDQAIAEARDKGWRDAIERLKYVFREGGPFESEKYVPDK